MAPNKYIPQLTFPRFLAALLIVIFHYGGETFPFNFGGFKELFLNGNIAVSFFFFLSGMVLCINYYDQSNLGFRTFIVKRIARIFPIYFLSFLITLILGMTLYNAYPKGISIVLQAFALQAWVPGICLNINYPGWSISVEMFFYLLFPFIIQKFRGLALHKVVLIVLGIWLISFLQHLFLETYYYDAGNSQTSNFILYFPLWHLNTFLFGVLTGVLVITDYFTGLKKGIIPFLLFFTGVALFLLVLMTNNTLKSHIHNGLLSPIFFMITLGLVYDKSAFTRLLANSKLVFLGDISYGLYILQYPVYLFLCWLLNREVLSGVNFYFYLLFLIVVSAISYLVFERKARVFLLKKWI